MYELLKMVYCGIAAGSFAWLVLVERSWIQALDGISNQIEACEFGKIGAKNFGRLGQSRIGLRVFLGVWLLAGILLTWLFGEIP